ncbi:MAG: leucine-rich repeat domain-containing protein [Firmicutes bacterium]|nr:leucine-rich repeat domain-containing protein [Bacillota bacterium]
MRYLNISKFILSILVIFLLSGCNNDPEEIIDVVDLSRYTITLENEDGSIYLSLDDLLVGTDIYLPVIEKEGFLFIGWDDGTSIHNQRFQVTSDLTLRAVFENQYLEYTLITDDLTMTASIVGYTGNETYLTIPDHIQGYLVNEISLRAFENSQFIEVEIPNSVQLIDFYAFANSAALEKVSFYGEYQGFLEEMISQSQYDEIVDANMGSCSITIGSIESGTYTLSLGCPISEVVSIESITLGGITYHSYQVILDYRFYTEPNHIVIRDYAFSSCESLTTIEFPSRLASFNPRILDSSPNITDVSFDENDEYRVINQVVYSENDTFLVYYPSGLLAENYIIPSGVIEIGELAFYSQHLKLIEIPGSLYDIAGDAFKEISSLEAFAIYEESTRFLTIDGVLFNYWEDLVSYPVNKTGTHYILPVETRSISQYAFANNRNLETIDLGENLYVIGGYAFMGAEKLTVLDIPASTTHILEKFIVDSQIRTIIIHRSVVIDGGIVYISPDNDMQELQPTFYVPDDSYQNYINDFHWSHLYVEIHPISELS